jgi:pimeloyl-ACP methyl ester carboxylesterase
MRGRTGTLTASLLAVIAAALASSPADAATSSIQFKRCPDAPSFGCARLVVPLDPSGATPGTISLAIRRQLSATGSATTAVVALAGGPGQAALPFAATASQIVAPALKTDDLVVFDQRGTGDSGPLKCSSLNDPAPASKVIPACAQEIGASRGFYTTADTVADIEAIRKALGYSKLFLYGISYGTYVALRYAASYPDNVAGLLLDSTEPPAGEPLFFQPTLEAVPRILRQTCSAGACQGIPHPVADLRTVLRHVDARPAHTIFRDSTGTVLHLRIRATNISAILLASDEDPSLRADIPAAIHSAAEGDYALLGVLFDHAILGPQANKTIDTPLYFDTVCEELPFPGTRGETPVERLASDFAAARAMPPGTFGPFSYVTAVRYSPAQDCAYWPNATAAPEAPITSLPDVPTLIISGADDLRTPTANARAVAAMIPAAKIVVVPNTGHSTLTTELFSTCGRDAVDAFLSGGAINTRCQVRAEPIYLRAAPAAPSSLAQVVPLHGVPTRAARTARAIELTLGWISREIQESLFETLIGTYNPSFSSGLGGLYGGFVKLVTKANGASSYIYHGFSFVPGVTISGRLSQGVGTLRIGGPGAVGGTLEARTFDDFAGTLGGVRVHFRISHAQLRALTA